MLKFLKLLLLIPFILLFIWMCYLNLQLYQQPTILETEKGVINQEVLHQLYHLKSKLGEGAAQEMQQLYPEGFLFLHALYVLAWSDIATNFRSESPLLKEATQSIDQSLGQMQSAEGKRIFSTTLNLKYGAFYTGWTAYAMGKRLAVAPDSLLKVRFQSKCKQIATTYRQQNYRYIESYHGSIWAADNMLCLASLSLHDRLYHSNYQTVLDSCLLQIKANLDEQTGLIPHSTDADTMQPLESARGSSQSLINNFLIEIDSSFAQEQFEMYKTLFIEKRLGLFAIREYPKGSKGGGDIDSGPVIWDIGGAASIVGMRTFMRYGEIEIARSLQNSVEAFGLPICLQKKKRYLLGILPIADAFIAWGNALNQTQVDANNSFSRGTFHLISLLILVLLSAVIYVLK